MIERPRRNRKSEVIRKLIRESHVSVDDLVQPIFLVDGENIAEPVPSLPIAHRYSVDRALDFIQDCHSVGVKSFILFAGVHEHLKDAEGSYGTRRDNFYLQAAQRIKAQFPECCLISDVAMDPYSSDGHDGIVKDGVILNDETLPILSNMAVVQAEAGFDIIGPSDMMDGRIGVIRQALDHHGHKLTSIMSYSTKYASAFYGPFRDALDSAPKAGDKKTYQMDPANRIEALREAELDVLEGADFLMVKPALHYLDIISDMKEQFQLPVTAYHVSGECAMLIAAAQNGWLDYELAVQETLLSIKRAGSDIIITYFAYDFARMK